MRERFVANSLDLAGGGTFGQREILPIKKEVPITAESLLADNRSDKAQGRIENWHINSGRGELIQSDTCADARQEVPDLEHSVITQSIGTAGPKEPYEPLVRNHAVKAVANIAHHSGDTVIPKKAPKGCGGLGAKEEMERSGDKGTTEGIGHFVENDIYHSDVIVQTCVSALSLSRMTDKPALAATQDHLTGIIHPLVAFWSKGNTSHSIHSKSIRLDDILRPDKYNPAKIYENGLPCIEIEDLPEVFQEYLAANRREIDKLHEDYPDYRERQTTQNPSTIVLSTDIRPLRLRFPDSFDAPGSVFRLSLPRRKFIDGNGLTLEIPTRELQRVINQVQYPMEHFSNARNMVIETRSYEVSCDLADSLKSKPFFQKWAEKNGAQIIIIESQGGRINRIGELKAA